MNAYRLKYKEIPVMIRVDQWLNGYEKYFILFTFRKGKNTERLDMGIYLA
jgi:hypothetical protein